MRAHRAFGAHRVARRDRLADGGMLCVASANAVRATRIGVAIAEPQPGVCRNMPQERVEFCRERITRSRCHRLMEGEIGRAGIGASGRRRRALDARYFEGRRPQRGEPRQGRLEHHPEFDDLERVRAAHESIAPPRVRRAPAPARAGSISPLARKASNARRSRCRFTFSCSAAARSDGGLALGDRKRILKAIASLPTAEPAAAAIPVAAPRTRDKAERRPVTVMFCDLVGSTSLAATLDAEDWRDLVGGYLDNATKAIDQHGGHVAKKLGDGLMALFGYPRAQENDAERAARAGLAILRALEDLNAANAGRGLPALAARIGLDSGPVVVDSTGEVFGDAPNLAARVQNATAPGTMLVTAAVWRQVAGLFVVEDKGLHELKGVPGSPVLHRIVRPAAGGVAPARASRHRLSGATTISLSSSNAGSAREAATGSRSDRRRAWNRKVASH